MRLIPKLLLLGSAGFFVGALNGNLAAQEKTGEQTAEKKAPESRLEQVSNAVIDVGELEAFEQQPAVVQKLLRTSLELAGRDLKYKYGSADPTQGGMDCSGTIYYLLREMGIKEIPRSSDSQYHWMLDKGVIHPVSATTLESADFSSLKPGDLLFWSGTYATKGISHVMIYLGRLKNGGKMVMIGSSEGRRYAGVARNGVSVFDFVLPKSGGGARFVGYGPIPGLVDQKSPEPAVASR